VDSGGQVQLEVAEQYRAGWSVACTPLSTVSDKL